MTFSVFKTQAAGLLLLTLATLFVYSSGISGPFYLDDFSSITENPAIISADWSATWQQYKTRIVGYASFVLNAEYIGTSAEAFRGVNIAIHLLVTFSVFGLLKGILLSRSSASPKQVTWLAFTLTCLFALHPLSTSAVTYIVQRLAALAALFYVIAILAYLYARVRQAYWAYALCALSIVLAILTKQNTVTVVVMLYFTEMILVRRVAPKILILQCVVLASLPILVLLGLYFGGVDLSMLDQISRETDSITRGDYLIAQCAVIGTYLIKFVWPHSLMLDYGTGLEFWLAQYNYVWAVLHISALLFALAVCRKLPIVAFGILFYYVALSVESSIIPIRDLIFEHRTYLPNVGLFIVIAGILQHLTQRISSTANKTLLAIWLVIASGFGYLSYERNAEWASPESFFSAESERNDGFWRSRNELASLYISRGDISLAAQLIDFSSLNEGSHPALLTNALNVLIRSKNFSGADALIEQVGDTLKKSHYRYKRRFYSMSGQLYMKTNRLALAAKQFNIALNLKPDYTEVLVNMGIVQALMGNYHEARRYLKQALVYEPGSARINKNLAVVDQLEQREMFNP